MVIFLNSFNPGTKIMIRILGNQKLSFVPKPYKKTLALKIQVNIHKLFKTISVQSTGRFWVRIRFFTDPDPDPRYRYYHACF